MSVDILPCPTYEGGSVFLNGFSDGPKPYEEVLTFLRKGTSMIKYGRIGAPKPHPFRLSDDMKELQWESKKGQIRRIPLKCVRCLERGQNSKVFLKYPKPESRHLSFTISYMDENKRSRTLDVICNDKHDFEMWFWGVQIIMHYPPATFYAAPPQGHASVRANAISSTISAPPATQRMTPQPPAANHVLPPARALPAVDDRRPKPIPKTKPITGLDLMKNMRSSGTSTVILQTDTRAQMGDLYAWGSLMLVDADDFTSSLGNTAGSHESLRALMQSYRPNLVGEAISVDVARVACAPRHAALITRNGELYTWGVGKDGNLGHGWCGNVPKPRLLTRMGGRGVRAVSCGEGASAAISAEQRLFMWGQGLAGQLGNGYAFPCAEPVPVIFPGLREDIKVLAVSCGPYHTAAITEGGLLYTWGNGLFGRLGHGSHRSEYRPRRVMELEEKCVIDVSCGYWHTAAVVKSRGGGRSRPASLTPSMDFTTPASTPGAHPYLVRVLPTAASVPNISSAADAVEDGIRAELTLRTRSRTADICSSGSDVQVAVAAAPASINTSRAHVRGSFGGGEPSGVHSGTFVNGLRDDVLSCSVASLDKLPYAMLEDHPESPPGAVGTLYTWGCDFQWMEDGKRDKHHGCLGLGDDVEGRLVPTRVRGDMDKHGVVQVACGWSMTIVLSADGRVYQMGSTGAHTTDKNCVWEGAKVPMRVDGNLFNLFVEEVACGMRHVVAVASRVQANGQIPDDQRRMKLITWGCGAEGQLGLWSMATSADAPVPIRPTQTDHSLPQIVAALEGRRVLHIAAGGNLTMAVMEHDPRSRPRIGPSMAPAPATHFGNSNTSTPSGGGAYSRTMSVAPSQSMVGSLATGIRDVSNAASFQLSQSLPITVAAAGLQSLQQIVAGSVGSRSKAGTPTAPPDVPFMPRRRPSRVVGIPQLTVSQPRFDHHHHRHRDLRRTTSRLLAFHQGFGGQVLQKALSSGGQDVKVLDAAASASSGMVSQRSSPPLGRQSVDVDSRSASPTSNSLYDVSNVSGDFQSNRHSRSAGLEPRPRTGSIDVISKGSSFAAAAVAAATNFSRSLRRGGSSGNVADAHSMGGNSTGDTPETDTDSYVHGGRSLDMVPEQSEDSTGSPSLIARHPHHARSTAQPHPHHPLTSTTAGVIAPGGAAHPHPHTYNIEGREKNTTQVVASPPSAAAMKPRLSRLGQPTPGGGPGLIIQEESIGETVRSSVSTMDSSYIAEGSASSELSPSGIVTASPETPGVEIHAVHPVVAGMQPGMALQYPRAEVQPSASSPVPQQHLPFASHLMALTPQQHHQQQHHPSPSSKQAGGMPTPTPLSRHGSLGPALSPQETLGRAGSGAGTSTPGSSGRNREISVPIWAQPQVAGVAAGGGVAGGHGSFRSNEISMRAYGLHPDGTAAASASAAVSGYPAANIPVGAGIRSGGSRGSRGHSRHASYDSGDPGSRDADGMAHRGNAVAIGVGGTTFDPRSAVFPMYGNTGASAPPRTTPDSITVNLMQQNEQLQKELDALRQQVALLTQAAGFVPAAASAGMLGTSSHPFPVAHSSVPPPQQQQQVTAAAAAAAAVAVAAAAVAVHTSPQAMGGGGLQPHAGNAGPAAVSLFADSAAGHGVGGSGQSAFSPQGSPHPAMLHHAHSAAISALTSPPGHSFPAGQMNTWSPGSGSGTVIDRQGSIAGVPAQGATVRPPSRHKRSASIDVSSLIATRDGIGPAKDYLVPAAQTIPPPSHSPQRAVERIASMPREGTAMGLHHTAPPALENLRQAHSGMSLAQAALADLAEEGVEDGYDDEDDEHEEGDPGEVETAMDESVGPSTSIDRLGSVTLSLALPLAAQGSLHRQMYVSQQQRTPTATPQLPQQQVQTQQVHPGRPYGANPVHGYEAYMGEATLESATTPKDGPARPTFEATYRSSASGDGSGNTASAADAHLPFQAAGLQETDVSLAAAAASAAAGVGAGGPIWRNRRNAFVEWVNTMHHEMSEENPSGSGGAGGSGSSGPCHSAMTGVSGPSSAVQGGDQSFPAGSVPLAPVAETLPPEGMQFQYAPGVYITLKPPAQKGDRIQLVKVRFNRKMFTEPSQGQAWWAMHKATLSELYHIPFDMGNKPPTPSTLGLPPLAPGPHTPVSSTAMHVRGISTDTQATSAGSTAASGSSLCIVAPATNSPVHGLAMTGDAGVAGVCLPAAASGAVPLGDVRSIWVSSASATVGASNAAGETGPSWTDVNYDDPSAMILPAPQQTSAVMMGSALPPRHHRSRSGSRTASGGSSHAGAPKTLCPESPMFALQQFGSSAAYAASGASVIALTQAHHPSHQRTRSGGTSSSKA